MIKHSKKRLIVSVIFIAALSMLNPAQSAALPAQGPMNPSQWPNNPGISPNMEGWPNAIRLWGEDRYQTSLSSLLMMRGNGSFPYSTPDPASGGARNLSEAHGWWGLNRCPHSVLIVAADSPADALSASSLSDSTGLSREPFLRRSSSADPLFDPVGGYSKVDTNYAPILVTASARSGATGLSLATRFGIEDVARGGCNRARQAIIIGGALAVPLSVEQELITLGVKEVFRVSGANRFATAAAVANSLGTQPVPSDIVRCSDSSVSDGSAEMAFYDNSVVEWRPNASECHLLGSTVVLADGGTGADALAAGWWTSFWQVPILLHNGSSKLPTATAAALKTLKVSNLIVLGGESRISTAVAAEAKALSGGVIRRVAGADRYETSIRMAEYFGGYWATGRGLGFASSHLCFAASSGSGSNARGWADALGAGVWCGMASGAAANPGAPRRALSPVTGLNPAISKIPSRPGHDASPLILVPAGVKQLPYSVLSFLSRIFEPADNWCSSVSAAEGCLTPGFATIFGGPSIIPESAVSAISAQVAGKSNAIDVGPNEPEMISAFVTALKMGPVYRDSGDGSMKVCVSRGGYKQARWLVLGFDSRPQVMTSADLMLEGWHLRDADGLTRSDQKAGPGCLSFSPGAAESVWVRTSSIDGRSSPIQHFPLSINQLVTMTESIHVNQPVSVSGLDTYIRSSVAGTSVLAFLSTLPKVGLISKNAVSLIESAGITITLNQPANGSLLSVTTFNANWSIVTAEGTMTGVASGEALLVDGIWQLSGIAQATAGSLPTPGGNGGFSAQLTVRGVGMGDDSLTWQLDTAFSSED